MEPAHILVACIVGLPVALVLWGLYLMTEGVDGISRRLYAMLLLLLSVLGAGLIIGLPIVLCGLAIAFGLGAIAVAVGIPAGVIGIVVANLGRASCAGFSGGGLNSWLSKYLQWIKRVAQGEQAQKEGAKAQTKGWGVE